MRQGAEILLDNKQQCNLTTLNLKAFSKDGEIADKATFFEMGKVQGMSVRAGIRMTLMDLELPEWDFKQKRDRLTGCSLMGFEDATCRMSAENRRVVLGYLCEVAHAIGGLYASQLRIPVPLLTTSEKPDGCWTPEFIRTTDNGILFVNEIEPSVEDKNGFTDVSSQISIGGNRVTKAFKNAIKDVLRITLENGRVLRVTPSHRISIGGEWIAAKDISVGDIVDYKLGQYTNTKEAPLVPITDELDKRRSDIRDYDTPREMSPDLAYLIGAYFANGCFTTNDRIKFHCGNILVNERIQDLWKRLFGVDTTIRRSTDRDSYTQDFRSTKIREWFRINGIIKYDDNGDMWVPKVIRTSSARSIIGFIVGYADNDGCFYDKKFCIDTARESFAFHLQELAEAVGICFSKCTNAARHNGFSKKPIFKLSFRRAHSSQFAINEINSMSIKAQQKG